MILSFLLVIFDKKHQIFVSICCSNPYSIGTFNTQVSLLYFRGTTVVVATFYECTTDACLKGDSLKKLRAKKRAKKSYFKNQKR